MATEAQIQANRLNAQKSTGPRTPEGKAVVAQNAVKHGLLGEQVVVAGEDRARFARHRDQMLRALIPVGEVETSLAERLIGLSWRLQRVQRLQVQAFEALCAGPGAGAAQEGSDEELALGRIVVQDFSQARVLDRLLMYERRLEHSLCRILGELRKERLFHNTEARTMDQGNPQVLLERFMRLDQARPTATLHVEPGAAWYEATPEARAEAAEQEWERVSRGECRGSYGRAALETSNLRPAPPEEASAGDAGLPHATEGVGEPAGNATEMPGPSGETHPSEEGLLRLKGEVSSGESHPAGLPTSNFTLETSNSTQAPAEELCETNPIRPGAKGGQVLDEQGIRSDSVPNGLGKTKPIGGRPAGLAAAGADG